MKFAVNHRDQFTNVYPAFLFGLLQTVICMIVEFNVMLMLTTIKDVLNVIMKYVSLAAISRIPGFYYSSLTSEHKLAAKVSKIKLKITKWRTRD